MSVQARENDLNGDGLSDELDLRLDMPLLDSERVYGVKLLIVFDYLLTVGLAYPVNAWS